MADIGVGAASFGIAVVALVAAVVQLTMQVDIEARRKGKTDRLALGNWAIEWPQTKLMVHLAFGLVGFKSPWGDPRVLTVPFITVGEMEKYLRAEGTAAGRAPLERRMQSRLVESATMSIATGDGRYTGRMYAVRGTTRKRSEACWSDALDMCGMFRDHWSLLTGVSAPACDGAVRPANAVTNLHSLWGFGRVMGMRKVVRSPAGTRITMTNGGASLYLDLYAGVDRPTRLAHFSGSPNGRYLIIEEMSQHTAQSIYADAVWAAGNIPDPVKLSHVTHGTKTVAPSVGNAIWDVTYTSWAEEFVTVLNGDRVGGDDMDMLDLVKSPVVVSCIRTYPVGDLPQAQVNACNRALHWCVHHWWLSRYQILSLRRQQPDVYRPRLPVLGAKHINPEFVTGTEQAREWCTEASQCATALADNQTWKQILQFVGSKVEDNKSRSAQSLAIQEHTILVRLLQCWKLMLYDELEAKLGGHVGTVACVQWEKHNTLTALLAAVSMACISVATDSTEIGDGEVNKAMEIELGSTDQLKDYVLLSNTSKKR
ncbi:hypothetical protein BD779DRAFT_1670449 [Infundibulicybe gibba]|nr:hypothetical protein BD779DRAFT_1670449 [Infundibulicybe gibba]